MRDDESAFRRFDSNSSLVENGENGYNAVPQEQQTKQGVDERKKQREAMALMGNRHRRFRP